MGVENGKLVVHVGDYDGDMGFGKECVGWCDEVGVNVGDCVGLEVE